MAWQTIIALLAGAGALIDSWLFFRYRAPARHRGRSNGCADLAGSFWGRVFYFRNETVEIAAYLLLTALVLSPYVLWQFYPLIFLFLLILALWLLADALFHLCLQAFVMRRRCAWRLGLAAINISLSYMIISLFWRG